MAGHKPIENHTLGAIRAGTMTPGRICLRFASGLNEEEFRCLHWRLGQHGMICPHPLNLIRGAIIGTVEVTGHITHSDSE